MQSSYGPHRRAEAVHRFTETASHFISLLLRNSGRENRPHFSLELLWPFVTLRRTPVDAIL
jgi:hypothetical protein